MKEIVNDFILSLVTMRGEIVRARPRTVRDLCSVIHRYFEIREHEKPVVSPVFTQDIGPADPFPLKGNEFYIGPCHFGDVDVEFFAEGEDLYLTGVSFHNRVRFQAVLYRDAYEFSIHNLLRTFTIDGKWEHDEDVELTDDDREYLIACGKEFVKLYM